MIFVVVIHSLSRVQLFTTPWTAACKASLSFTVSQSLLRFMSIELVMLSNHHILCRPLLFLPSVFPSTRVFSKELALRNRWPLTTGEYWTSASASVSILNIVSVVYMWQSQYIFNTWKKQARKSHTSQWREAQTVAESPEGTDFSFHLYLSRDYTPIFLLLHVCQ